MCKPVAGYERRDVEQFRKMNVDRAVRSVRAARGSPEGNINRMKHGAYANRFLSAEEQAIFHELVCGLRKDFHFNASSDFLQVELVGIYFLKIGRALGEDNIEAVHKIDQMLRGHLKDLKATKLGRVASDSKGPGITPAEMGDGTAGENSQGGEGKSRSRLRDQSGAPLLRQSRSLAGLHRVARISRNGSYAKSRLTIGLISRVIPATAIGVIRDNPHVLGWVKPEAMCSHGSTRVLISMLWLPISPQPATARQAQIRNTCAGQRQGCA